MPVDLQQLGRQLALTGRYVTEGVGNTLATPGALYDAAMDSYDASRAPTEAELATGKRQTGIRFRTRAALEGALNRFAPQPQTPAEKLTGHVVGSMAGVAPLAGAGSSLAASGGTALSQYLGNLIAEMAPGVSASAALGPAMRDIREALPARKGAGP